MTFCSQNRHATTALYFDIKLKLIKKIGFEPMTKFLLANLQSAALTTQPFLFIFVRIFLFLQPL